MAGLYFATFWLIIFTGAIRKWMFPHTTVLYLLQDVPLVFAYIIAFSSGVYSRSVLFMGTLALSLLLILQGLLQIIGVGLTMFIFAVGVHNYLFYLPILLVFPICLTEKYRQDFVRWNLYLSIPMALLALAQNKAPRAAWINKTSEGEAFSLPGSDVARVSGTFNFVSFYAIWAGLVVALLVGEWLLPRERRAVKKLWLLLVCTVTTNLCFLVSGSRTAVALAGMAVIGGMVAAVVLGSTRAILSIVGIVFLLPVGVVATYIISPDEYNIMVIRFTGEGAASDNADRLQDGMIGFITRPKFDPMGVGIGMGVDAAHVGSTDAYNFTYALSEYDMIRNVKELGSFVGMAYVLIRIFFFLMLIALAVRITGSGSSPHVLPLSFFLMAQSYQGDLTRNAAISGSMVMTGCAYILGAYYNPDNSSGPDFEAGELTTRSA
jgi:hypothetical protein